MTDMFLDAMMPLAERSGHAIVRYEDCAPGSEFPADTQAVYITGPTMPASGLPFCVPKANAKIWAKRIVVALAIAFTAGEANQRGEPDPHVH